MKRANVHKLRDEKLVANEQSVSECHERDNKEISEPRISLLSVGKRQVIEREKSSRQQEERSQVKESLGVEANRKK